MKTKKVIEIITPLLQGVPHSPSVEYKEDITQAIKIMLNGNLQWIRVVRNNKPIGMIRLKDAFREVGL